MTEVEVRVGRFKNGKTTGKDEVTGDGNGGGLYLEAVQYGL